MLLKVAQSALLLAIVACGPPSDATAGDATSGSSDDSTGLLPAASESTAGDPGTVTSDASSSDESGDASDGGFIVDTEGPVCGPPPDGTSFHCWECDVWRQDCRVGDKCNPRSSSLGDTWNATICTPYDPDGGGPGDRCTVERTPTSGRDSCRIGSTCWNVDPATLEGECVELCQGSEQDPICATPATDCMIANDGVLVLCLPTCDPLDADACEAGHACRLVNETWFCLPDGAPVRDGSLTPALCEPGTTAVDPDALSTCEADAELCCASICDVASPTCTEPLQCSAVGSTGAGVCVDP